MADTAVRIAYVRSVLPTLESALHSFTNSSSTFRIVRTINPTTTPPKTLYILDSSFNPPSIAHLALATSALRDSSPTDAPPHRLLLLFATQNADKAPSPASYTHRLALMILFAEDLSRFLVSQSSSSPKSDLSSISIDIGLTTAPYYTDKSTAIATSEPPAYPSSPVHVHLVGFDTLVRFCNSKYYPKHTPPLSALVPLFGAGHKLRVTERPADASDASSDAYGSVESQREYVDNLAQGGLEDEGFRSEWARQIDLVSAAEGTGVSSTRVRRAAEGGEWEVVGRLCTEGVSAYVREARLYRKEEDGTR
ncbi:Nucleotidylyl transferase [Mytilinidion resinicola]|uniref:Nucleotidylyl transferase n=1 Tax=Mytilinidion resinicola TaxID=574789 RepID=A0A6A6YLL6_9PEZI|nr:Nucleotidylyl transferase [Mytilinidion resinicola]KAF2809428.1 Nucleotidylyl transferase [Mytilinidion resinicola]